MKWFILCFTFFVGFGSGFTQSAYFNHPDYGKVYTKTQRDPSFSRVNGDANLQTYFSDYFEKNRLIPPGLKTMVILTLLITKKGEAYYTKAICTDPAVDLNALKLQKAIELMNSWIPAIESDDDVHFQVMLSLKFDQNLVTVRRMGF
mgnify:FL=1